MVFMGKPWDNPEVMLQEILQMIAFRWTICEQMKATISDYIPGYAFICYLIILYYRLVDIIKQKKP